MSAELSSCPLESSEMLAEAPLAYTVYAFTGGFSLLCTLSVSCVYGCNKSLRLHPNGILIHLIMSLFAFSLVYFVSGLSYLLWYRKNHDF